MRKAGLKSSRKEPSSRARVSLIARIPDGRGLGGVGPGEDGPGLVLARRSDQPARALRDAQEQQEEEDRGDRPRGEHPAPIRGAGAGEDPVDEIGQRMPVTMASWLTETRAPRMRAGATSAM